MSSAAAPEEEGKKEEDSKQADTNMPEPTVDAPAVLESVEQDTPNLRSIQSYNRALDYSRSIVV